MIKNLVLDTNVLIHDPEAVFKFDDNDVYIPIFVIEEIDKFKRESTERGRNCRHFCRILDKLRSESDKPLSDGVSLGEKLGTLTIYVPKVHDHNESLDHGAQDRAILNAAIEIRDRDKKKKKKTIFITMDTNLRIRADAIGMESETYENSKTDTETEASVLEIGATKDEISELFTGKVEINVPAGIRPNSSIMLKNLSDLSNTALGRYCGKDKVVKKLNYPVGGVMGIRPKNREQSFALDLLLDDSIQLVTLLGKAGTGKSQPLSEPVATPKGFVPMGSIKKDDYVIGKNGQPVKVLEIFPQGTLDIYKVDFSDGSSTRCSIDHLWDTRTYFERNNGSPYKTRTTEEILKTIKSNRSDNRKNHSIPTVSPVEFQESEIDIDPYVMGLLLGDGCLRHNISFSISDTEIIDSVKELIPNTTSLYRKSEYDWDFKRTQRNNKKHDIKVAIEKYGLYGCYANNKFVPEQFKRNSIQNRISLLQGMLDSDGTLDYRNGKNVLYTTVSKKLKDDMIFIVQSLGGIARFNTKKTFRCVGDKKIPGQIAYVVNISLPPEIQPFRLSRKKNSYKPKIGKGNRSLVRYITDIKLVGTEECQCLLVDSADHLYVTNNFIVTHNTLVAIAAGLDKILNGGVYSKMLVSRPVMPLGKDIGFLPGSVEEKLAPWMQPIFDNLEFIFSKGKKIDNEAYQDLLKKGIVQVEPLTYIRGRSLPYQYMIVDECLVGNTLIATENGKMSIRNIFDHVTSGRKTPKVRSFNENTKSFEWKDVISTRCVGSKPTITVRMANRKITCTDNHLFLTENRGWVEAINLKQGELVITTPENSINSIQSVNHPELKSLILGSFLGDGHLQNVGPGRKRLVMRHGMKQEEYCKWKISNIGGTSKISQKNGFSQKPACVSTSYVFGSQIDYPSNKSSCTKELVQQFAMDLDAKALAIWFMDDGSRCVNSNGKTVGGTIHTESFSVDVCEELIKLLARFDIKAAVHFSRNRPYIRLNKEAFYALSSMIAGYTHKSMDYKLHEDHANIAGSYVWEKPDIKYRLHGVDEIINGKNEYVYDIGVEGNHNFVVTSRGRGSKSNKECALSGVVVHNCQNLTVHELKTILTRAGEGTKIVLTGDPDQIDNPYVDASSNGLSVIADKFREQTIAGHIVLTKGERSALAELAATIL